MRYAYGDLGRQQEGTTAVVRWGGSAATVILLDPVNFAKYVRRMPFIYGAGGHYHHSPARLTTPSTGRWYVVADLGAYVSQSPPTVEVVAPSGAPEHGGRQQPLVGAV